MSYVRNDGGLPRDFIGIGIPHVPEVRFEDGLGRNHHRYGIMAR
jgi:hypothetical protein